MDIEGTAPQRSAATESGDNLPYLPYCMDATSKTLIMIRRMDWPRRFPTSKFPSIEVKLSANLLDFKFAALRITLDK